MVDSIESFGEVRKQDIDLIFIFKIFKDEIIEDQQNHNSRASWLKTILLINSRAELTEGWILFEHGIFVIL